MLQRIRQWSESGPVNLDIRLLVALAAAFALGAALALGTHSAPLL
ncbi:MAG: hypothetical protein PHX58_07335 [Desulfovibrio sp.]|jgi:hypothetical protein|nr:hypothetical protein [Desulfovibrio sp.]